MDTNRGCVEVRKGEYRIPGMSRALRHAPEDYGIALNKDGTVRVQDLADAFNVYCEDVLNVVATDAKGRYEIVEGDNEVLFVRALHGHSIPVTIEMSLISNPGTIFHGTKARFLNSILHTGLHRGERNYVHLSAEYSTAVQVAHRRKGETVLLIIDGTAVSNSGRNVYLTATNIYLVDEVPSEFITEIVYV